MKILVINPNASEIMTNHLREELDRIKRPDTKLTIVCNEKGPKGIESAYDEALAVPPTLDWVKKGNQEAFDAIIIACFSDPGLVAAKEISKIPVIGIEEASLHMAAMLGAKFSILTTKKERIPSKRERVYRRGLDHFLASVRSLDLSVAETDANPEKTKARILDEAKKAIAEDGAEVIVLGGAGMAGYASDIESKLIIKVLDPTAVALKVAEAMVDLGLTQSKIGLFHTPLSQSFQCEHESLPSKV
jgi:allantoin racemase